MRNFSDFKQLTKSNKCVTELNDEHGLYGIIIDTDNLDADEVAQYMDTYEMPDGGIMSNHGLPREVFEHMLNIMWPNGGWRKL